MFLHKLVKRIARTRALPPALVLVASCGNGGTTSPDAAGNNSPFVLTPKADTLQPGQTAQFSTTALSSCWQDRSVSVSYWATGGTITGDGLYTAGAVAGTFLVVATCLSGQADTAEVTISSSSQPVAATSFGAHMDLMYDANEPHRQQVIAAARALGVKVSRNSFLWHQIEPARGQLNWGRADSVVAELRAAGIEPLMVVVGSPSWASGTSDSVGDFQFYIPQDQTAFDAWVAQYAAFMSSAVSRYRGQVHKWELWNEPNDYYFWKPGPSVPRYAQWFLAVQQAIKGADPEAQIALGGLSALSYTGPNGMSGYAFLQALYAQGVSPAVVAIHPYAGQNQAPDVTLEGQNNFSDIGRVHDLMVANGAGANPLWVTEWGWPTTAISETTQAEYVSRSLVMLTTQYSYVTLATYFMDRDDYGYFYGLADASLRPRPAGIGFRDFVTARGP